jgi:hypothetical protein
MLIWKAQSAPDKQSSIDYVNEKYGIGFKRPTEIPSEQGGSSTPSLWGSKGVQPEAAV